jgi:hypothetical protein
VLTPTIGEWDERTLAAWSVDVGVALKKVHLKWISEAHPWAATSGWALSKAASENLQSSGVQLDCLPKEARFTEQHRDGDPRWSHAKLYLLRSRRRRRLLITSANWSAAAWGAGRTARNFELGVVFESEWTDLEALGEPFDPPETVPFCVDRVEDEERVSALEWAEASWDGRRIALRARSTDSVAPMRRPAAVTALGADYAVQDWIDARAAFSVVDKWRAALDEAAAEAPRREQVRMDGEELRALFARREGPGALLVVEELGWRLEEEVWTAFG